MLECLYFSFIKTGATAGAQKLAAALHFFGLRKKKKISDALRRKNDNNESYFYLSETSKMKGAILPQVQNRRSQNHYSYIWGIFARDIPVAAAAHGVFLSFISLVTGTQRRWNEFVIFRSSSVPIFIILT